MVTCSCPTDTAYSYELFVKCSPAAVAAAVQSTQPKAVSSSAASGSSALSAFCAIVARPCRGELANS